MPEHADVGMSSFSLSIALQLGLRDGECMLSLSKWNDQSIRT